MKSGASNFERLSREGAGDMVIIRDGLDPGSAGQVLIEDSDTLRSRINDGPVQRATRSRGSALRDQRRRIYFFARRRENGRAAASMTADHLGALMDADSDKLINEHQSSFVAGLSF
jgi:hypothetical protein